MSSHSISTKILNFFQNQEINLTEISPSLYLLPEDNIKGIPVSILLDFTSPSSKLLIRIHDSNFIKLPTTIIDSKRLKKLKQIYNETGQFNKILKSTEVPEFLIEMSSYIHKLFSALDLNNEKNTEFINLFKQHIKAKRKSLRNPSTNRLSFRINQERYLHLAETNKCIWLGDLIIEIEPVGAQDCYNATCWLENSRKSSMMVYKTITNLNNLSNFKQVFLDFDFSFHKDLLITQEVFAFISTRIEKWFDFTLSIRSYSENGIILYYRFKANKNYQIEIEKHEFENPLALLTKINDVIQRDTNSSVSLNPD